jgi:hypothetical protein
MHSWVKRGFRTTWILGATIGCGGDGGPTGNNGGGNQNVTLTARHGHVMVYDEARRQLLLFGGTGTEGTLPSGDRNSTWTWDGTTWARIATTGPSPRYLSAVVYDATRQRVVLHGGQSGVFPNITVLSDTWEWDGTTWTQKATTGPSPRVHQTMAYDRARGRVILYGGFNSATQQELGDIWEWDGTSWQRSGATGLANSIALGVAYDEKAAALYLDSMAAQGSSAPVASRLAGTTLTPAASAAPPCVPVPRQFTALGSNPGGFLLYVHSCDQAGTILPQSWRWDGTTWTRVQGTQPSLRYNAAMAYDRDRNRVVLYGGEVGAGTPDLADTWEFDGTTWTRR